MEFCFGFQFKYDIYGIPKILECNPRVQGTMIFSTFMGANIIYAAVKSCLGEFLPEFSLNWDTKLIRYWGAIGITGHASKNSLIMVLNNLKIERHHIIIFDLDDTYL